MYKLVDTQTQQIVAIQPERLTYGGPIAWAIESGRLVWQFDSTLTQADLRASSWLG